MITRKRGRAHDQQKAEVKSPSPLHVDDVCEWVETMDRQQQATSCLQSSPEGEDGSGLDLDDLLSFDGFNWSFEEDAFSPLFETEVAPSTDVDVLVKRNKMEPARDSSEQPASPTAECAVQKSRKLEEILPGRINKNAIAARMNRLKKKEYVNGLEKKVGALVSENCSLKEENSNLIKRVEELEDETRRLTRMTMTMPCPERG
ncbi:CREB/ATF bZIP transcription factor isoform X2 [Scleropages formosus]|uniref:CREB/ATF bZIP transcription factor isoform X2 n=1 Tax=Scleropages formosus TaxID=113540 RepID=UPI0010FACCE6|nr:CREB/ATF bZIP transcription factor isoform X2 [Scleropages formosus]